VHDAQLSSYGDDQNLTRLAINFGTPAEFAEGENGGYSRISAAMLLGEPQDNNALHSPSLP